MVSIEQLVAKLLVVSGKETVPDLLVNRIVFDIQTGQDNKRRVCIGQLGWYKVSPGHGVCFSVHLLLMNVYIFFYFI